MAAAVREAPRRRQLSLITAHPDLAGKAARAGTLTSDSSAEQASAGLDRLSEAGIRALSSPQRCLPHEVRHAVHHLRATARQGFDPAAVRAPARATIPRPRSKTALARCSASQRFASTSTSRPPTGSRCTAASPPMCSTPTPAVPPPGVAVELLELSEDDDPRLIARAVTNHDGRTDAAADRTGSRCRSAATSCAFASATTLRALGTPLADPPFLGHGAGAICRRRAGGPLPRPAAGHALELHHLSRKLTVRQACRGNRQSAAKCLVLRQA